MEEQEQELVEEESREEVKILREVGGGGLLGGYISRKGVVCVWRGKWFSFLFFFF